MYVFQNIGGPIHAVSHAVRFVALYRGGKLTSRQRSQVSDASASASVSDRYDELFVNPTHLTPARQPGLRRRSICLSPPWKLLPACLDLHDGHHDPGIIGQHCVNIP
jgi:hypothetical protein